MRPKFTRMESPGNAGRTRSSSTQWLSWTPPAPASSWLNCRTSSSSRCSRSVRRRCSLSEEIGWLARAASCSGVSQLLDQAAQAGVLRVAGPERPLGHGLLGDRLAVEEPFRGPLRNGRIVFPEQAEGK